MLFFTLCRYRLIQNLRLPISFVWTIGLPIFLFIIIDQKIKTLAVMSAYIVLSNYVYGISLSLLYDRESGFLKSFIVSKKMAFMHSLSLFFVSSFLSLFSISVFYVFAFISYNEFYFKNLLSIILFLPFLYGFSMIILLFRKEVHEISAILNVCFIVFVTFSYLTHDIVKILNFLNPLYLYYAVIIEQNLYYMFASTILALLGFFAIWRFDKQPLEGRR